MRGWIDVLAENMKDSLEISLGYRFTWFETRFNKLIAFYAASLICCGLALMLK